MLISGTFFTTFLKVSFLNGDGGLKGDLGRGSFHLGPQRAVPWPIIQPATQFFNVAGPIVLDEIRQS